MTDLNGDVLLNGEECYRNLREQLESEHLGDYVMIELRSGDYVLGSTTTDVHGKFINRFGADAPVPIFASLSTIVGSH